jgi:hypothetical protein
MQFIFVIVIPKYVNTEFYKDLLAIIKLYLGLHFGGETTVNLVFPAFPFIPTSLLASNSPYVFFLKIFIFPSGIEQELMCFVQFQSFLIFLGLPDGIF